MARFVDQLGGCVGKRVRLGRGGDKVEGTLVRTNSDYLTLQAADGTLHHYPLHHAKSVTELVGTEQEEENGTSAVTPAAVDDLESFPQTWWGLVQSLLGRKIKVYHHGPEAAAGFLFEVGDDFLSLVVSPDEMVRYPAFHIRSVAVAQPKQKDNNKKNEGDGGGGGGGAARGQEADKGDKRGGKDGKDGNRRGGR